MARDRRLLTRRARSAYRLQYSIAHVQVGVGNGKGAGVWLRARTFPFPSAKKVLRARLRGRDPSTGRAGPCARKHTPSRATASTGQSSGPHLAAPRGGDDEATGGDGGDDDGNSSGGGDDDDGMDGGGGKQRRQPRAGGAPASRTTHTCREQWAEVRTRGSGVAVINVIHSHINAQLGAANSSSKSSVLRLVSMPAAVSSSSLHRFLNLASPSMRPPAVARRSGPPLPNTS